MTGFVKRTNQRKILRCKVIGMIVCLVILAAAVRPVSAAQTEIVRVGFFAFDGYHMQDQYGDRSGYGYEYLQYMGKYSNFVYEYDGYNKSWEEVQDMLEKGQIDMLTSAQKTKERMKKFDFSDRPIGTSKTLLTVKAGNSRYMNGDLRKLNGIRVGMLKENSRNDSFRTYAKAQGFSYKTVIYNSSKEMLEALQSGKNIDAVVTSNLRKIQNEWVVASFDPSPYYVMVKKGNHKLLEQINDAISQIELYKPNLQTELYNRYYSAENGDDVSYTAEERNFINEFVRKKKTLKILLNPDRKPFSYYKDGKIKGVMTDILDEIMERTGIPYEIIPTRTREEYEKKLLQGGTQICFDSRYDLNKAEREGYELTDPYLEATISRITNKKFTGTPKTIATVKKSDIAEGYISKYHKSNKVLYFKTLDDCVNAVLSGKADAVYLYTYTAQQYIYEDDRNQLQETLIPNDTVKFAMAVEQKEDPALFSILNKAVLSISGEDIDHIVQEKISYPVKDFTVRGYFYSNPWAWGVAGFVVVLLISGTVFLVYRRKNRRLEQEKSREFERFITYVCRANDAVMEYNLDGRKIFSYQMNEGRILKQEEMFTAGDQLHHNIHPDDWENVKDKCGLMKIRKLAESGGEIYFECRSLRKSNQYIWFSYTLQGIPGNGTESDRVMIFLKNIHQAKKQEAEKRQALEDALISAQQAGQAKGEFMSKMSHEIRTPLNAIIGYLQIAKGAVEQPEKIKDCLQKQEYAAQHLLDIINDVLDIASIESGKTKLDDAVFNIQDLLAETAAIFESQARHKEVKFEMKMEGITSSLLLGDRLRVNQILMNLLSNAVKFTSAGGKVQLRISQRAVIDGRVHLQFRIQDTGIGMTKGYMERIFTPFEQQDASTAKHFGGTGLGLSITNNLVNMMNGTIHVQSEEGKGSIFTVGLSFQIADTETSAENAEADQTRTTKNSGEDIFSGMSMILAEDNEMNREIVKEILKDTGLNITCAETGREALEIFENSTDGTYQMILMDIQMPVMDGYEAARRIRACGHSQARKIPIIACSADAFTEDVNKALAAGMNDHISKPIDYKKLCHILNQYWRQNYEKL